MKTCTDEWKGKNYIPLDILHMPGYTCNKVIGKGFGVIYSSLIQKTEHVAIVLV